MICFFTSIAPFQIDKQSKAIQTWLDLGAKVHSVNSQEEIDQLEKVFPQVKFHPALRHGRDLYGKPYIFINDIFLAAQKALGIKDTFVLCNSDVFLDGNFFDRSAFAVDPAEMVLATRFNVPSRDIPIGVDYDCGVDLFCTRATALAGFDMHELCLGVPFWDFWLPVLAISKGFKIRKLNYPLLIHVNHPENYSHTNLQKSGVAYLRGLTRINPGFKALQERLSSALSTPKFDEILVNELIFPTLALLQRKLISVPWRDDSSLDTAHKMFVSLKHSASIALDSLDFFFDKYDSGYCGSPIDISRTAAVEAVEKGMYPLYSNFYARTPDTFRALAKSVQIDVLTKAFLPVINSVACFSAVRTK
jgi:hypothetical protein